MILKSISKGFLEMFNEGNKFGSLTALYQHLSVVSYLVIGTPLNHSTVSSFIDPYPLALMPWKVPKGEESIFKLLILSWGGGGPARR